MNLNDAIQECWSKIDEGQVATYIPALAKVDPYQLGVYLFDVTNDKKAEAGASQVEKLNAKLQEAGFDKLLTADEDPKFVVGYVEKITDHPKSDHLKVTQTRIADDKTVQIVCGSPNVAEGIKVVVARPGAMMPDGKIIWPGQLMGVDSAGMLCGFRELRIKNAPDEKGLFIIPDDWQEVGEPVDFTKADTFYPEN